MSCSADYYFVFWSGSADYYFESLLRDNIIGGQGTPQSTYTVLRVPQCLSPSLELGPPHPSPANECVPPPECAKIFFCKHWKHLLVGIEVLVAPTSTC
jgi:hypothetical protein